MCPKKGCTCASGIFPCSMPMPIMPIICDRPRSDGSSASVEISGWALFNWSDTSCTLATGWNSSPSRPKKLCSGGRRTKSKFVVSSFSLATMRSAASWAASGVAPSSTIRIRPSFWGKARLKASWRWRQGRSLAISVLESVLIAKWLAANQADRTVRRPDSSTTQRAWRLQAATIRATILVNIRSSVSSMAAKLAAGRRDGHAATRALGPFQGEAPAGPGGPEPRPREAVPRLRPSRQG